MDPGESHKSATTELFQAQVHIYHHIFNYITSMALKSAVELGIPDAIHRHATKPITLPELAAALDIPPPKTAYLYRLMRLLVHSGFFAEEEQGYVLTPSSKLLVKDNANCLSSFVMSVLQPEFVTPGHVMGDWLKDNGGGGGDRIAAFERAYGVPFWEYYNDRNPEFGGLFNEAMADDSRMMNLVVGDCGNVFEGVDSLVDAGGGTGTFVRIISEAFPGIKCKVLDLPHVVGELASSANLEFVPGDVFQHVPSADAVSLRSMLHSFSDEDCVKILKKCKEAISSKGEGGKVMIIDSVMNEKKDGHELAETKMLFDVMLMLMVDGRERSEKEWERLFLKTDFKHYKITPNLFGLKSLIEVFP